MQTYYCYYREEAQANRITFAEIEAIGYMIRDNWVTFLCKDEANKPYQTNAYNNVIKVLLKER